MTEQEPSELKLTPELGEEILIEIGKKREDKDRQKEALQDIRNELPRFKEAELHEGVVNLYWNEYLVGKHFAMHARDTGGLSPGKIYEQAAGFFRMRSSAKKALEYYEGHAEDIEEQIAAYLSARSNRFLGEVSMMESVKLRRAPRKAEEHFARAVEEFEGMAELKHRINALELSGFLAEAMVLNGEIDEGIELAKETFKKYDEGDGAELKELDYYTWAVWKSGCATKISHAIIQKGVDMSDETKEEILQILNESNDLLVIPENEETWGDKNFLIRKLDVETARVRIDSM